MSQNQRARKVSVLTCALALSSGCSDSQVSAPLSHAGNSGTSASAGAPAASGGAASNSGGGGNNSGSAGVGNTAATEAGRAGAGGSAGAGGATAAGGSATEGGGPAGTGEVSAEAPGVRHVGRTSTEGGATRFGWPGVTFRARFSGTQAAVQLNDGSNQNAFEVVVDGGAAKKFRTQAGQSSYPLASGLASGSHELLLWRSTEVFDSGATDFIAINGFSADGALLSPPPARERRMEVIGDSISVGAGLEGGASGCAANKNSTDNYFAYGSIAARAVEADLVTIAYSGIGVYRSYSASDPTMPQRYDRALPGDAASVWDFAKYQPHVVVINLGTNDFGAGDPGQPYVDAYVEFVKHVRAKYSDAFFMLIAMYGNQETAVSSVVQRLEAGGEARIELLKLNAVQNNKGCAQHPDAAAQQAMGELLAASVKAALNW